MIFKSKSNLGFTAFCLYIIVRVSFADPKINQRERESLERNQKYNVSSAVTKMISRIPLNGTVSQKMFVTIQKHPRTLDVAFAVGPEKTIVRAPRLILISSSPVFEREFGSQFEQPMMEVEEMEGIPLPLLDPEAFKIFVELIILDSWSVDSLKALELPSNQLLHLMSICHKYEMTQELKNLTELAKDFLRDFGTLVKPEDFLLLSQPQLETILASDELYMDETDVYNYACSWAKEVCKRQGLEVTGSNMRLVLGGCIHQIRFPIMSITEFGTVIQPKGLLSVDEITEIVQLIGMAANGSILNDTTELKFRVKSRNYVTSIPVGSSRISLTQIFPVVDTPFVCDGSEKDRQHFNMNMTITLYGVGFVGPIDANSFYNVTVQVQKWASGWTAYTSKMEKRIFARKSTTFYFIFDQPIVLDPIPYDQYNNCYGFWFSLKGPNTRSLQSKYELKKIYDNHKEFVINWKFSQLVEILYKTL